MSPHPAELARMRSEVAALSDAVSARFNALLTTQRALGTTLPPGLSTAAAEIRRVHEQVGRFLATPQADPVTDAHIMSTLIDVQRRTLSLLANLEQQPQPRPAAEAPRPMAPPLMPWQDAAATARTQPITHPGAPRASNSPAAGHSPPAPYDGPPYASPQPAAPRMAPPRPVRAPAPPPQRTQSPSPRAMPPMQSVPPQQRPVTAPPQTYMPAGQPPTRSYPPPPEQPPLARPPSPAYAPPGTASAFAADPQRAPTQPQQRRPGPAGPPTTAPPTGQTQAAPAFDPAGAGYANLVRFDTHGEDASDDDDAPPPRRRNAWRLGVLATAAVFGAVAMAGLYIAGPRLGRVMALVRGGPVAKTQSAKPSGAKPAEGAIPAVVKADGGLSAANEPRAAFVPVLATFNDYSTAREAFVTLKQRYPELLGNTAPDIETITVPDGGTWHRLGVLPALPREKAQMLCQQLQAAGHQGCWVRPQG